MSFQRRELSISNFIVFNFEVNNFSREKKKEKKKALFISHRPPQAKRKRNKCVDDYDRYTSKVCAGNNADDE